MEITKWGGVPFTFNPGTTLIIPPLALGDHEQVVNQVAAVKGQLNSTIVIDMAWAALKRNYPEMTREQVGALVDMGNKQAIYNAVMGVSTPQIREDLAPGEAGGPSTGASSTQS